MIGIGLLGAGTVGGTLVRRLVDDRSAIATKTGLDLRITKIGVRSLDKARPFEIGEGVLTDDLNAVVDHPDVHLVVELMGGLEPAGDLVLRAIEAGKPVITANKELIAIRGPELIAAASSRGVPLLFEAAVGGGIPIIRPLSETLAGEKITSVLGIVNGTTNYILTQMAEHGTSYGDALAAAQELGYAEPDPTADVTGADAAAKASILASLAFGTWVGRDQVHHEGIDNLSAEDITAAQRLGYTVKLLAIADQTDAGVCARVYPAMLPNDHPLAAIRGATNAVYVAGPAIDQLLFAGPGAGGDPTATAVLGDVIDAAREILAGAQAALRIQFSPGEIVDFGEIVTQWYIRLEVADQPGVLAQIAGAFGDAQVSIESMSQEGRGDAARLIIITHQAKERQQRAAVAALEGLDIVRDVGAIIRVEGPTS
ncbi:MAG: homoserine dehydrogenase [Acidimicrobiia bacterium]|nr:homoserine dehydrogenase [Acidimicrobiia bacterium]